MRNKTRTILFLAAGLLLLAGLLVPLVAAREGIWGMGWADVAARPQYGSEFQISPNVTPPNPDAERHVPAVAYNSRDKEYLVVWHNNWPNGMDDIYARRVSTTGELQNWFCVTTGAGGDNRSRLQPAVAWNGRDDQYLVVWMYDTSGTSGVRYEVWGKIIPWNGPGTSSEFRIYGYDNYSTVTPVVAWDSLRDVYMVAWNDFNLSLTSPINVSDRLVQSDGSMPYPANTIASTDYPHQVDIAYNLARDEYLVAYVKVFSAVPPSTANDIYGARLRWDGAVTRSDYAIITWLKNQNAPALATNNADSYMLVFQTVANDDPEHPDNDIYRQEINATTGDPIDGASILSHSANDDTNPDVAAGSNQYLATWQEDMTDTVSIWTYWWVPSGPAWRDNITPWVFWDNENPAVAAGTTKYLVAYEGGAPDPNIHRHIYGQLYRPYTVYLPLARKNV